MDALAAAIAKKRKSTQDEFKGRKYVKRAELEEMRIRKLLEEEQSEQQARASPTLPAEPQEKLPKAQSHKRGNSAAAPVGMEQADEEDQLPMPEVLRRLRALDQPITLFGEDDAARRVRLKQAGKDLKLTDEQRGQGQQNNTLLELQRAARRPNSAAGTDKIKRPTSAAGTDKAAEPSADAAAPQKEADGSTPGHDATTADTEAEAAMAAFEAAAAAVKAQQAEAAMTTEDRIAKHLKQWCAEWETDLERRPAEVKESGPGIQVMTQYKQTMAFIKPLYRDLAKRRVPGDMLAGLWMIVDAIRNRNYLYGYDIYMRLAIGNAPWPIGVTSIGIHERSSREKISHATGMNVGGAAHIMNDEATRKYLQAMKRLLSFMQRAYPTDPSRSVDFDGFRDQSRGAIGAGSDKLALLDAERSGTTWRDQGLKAAPHFLDADGTVKVPQSWQSMVNQTVRQLGSSSPTRSGTPPLAGRNTPALPSPASPSRLGGPQAAAANKALAAAHAAGKPTRTGSPLRTS